MRLYMIALALLASVALAAPQRAGAAPATPKFGASIDDYAEYDGQDTCDPSPKPGVLGLRDLVHATYGPHIWGIARSCASAGISEHEEGRALDYHFNYYNAEQRTQADDLLAWLLATDRHGNAHAMARRLGLMYIIWNRQIWESYRPHSSWQHYGGSNPHTDHIHFSFSWPGALAQTSWWTGGQVAAAQVGQMADFDGDGRLDYASFGTAPHISRNTSTPGAPSREPAQQIAGDWAQVRDPRAADWDGDGRADILGNLNGLQVWLGRGDFTFAPAVPLGAIEGTLNPADFDGDGKPDLAAFDGDTIALWRNTSSPGSPSIADTGMSSVGWSDRQQLVATDFDGDGRADILGRAGGVLHVWLGAALGAAPGVALGDIGNPLPPADFDGDTKPDLGVLSNNGAYIYFHRNMSTPGAPALAVGEPVIGGWVTQLQLLTNDFDGDGRADVVGRRAGVLQVWLSNSNAGTWNFQSYVALVKSPDSIRDDPGGQRADPVAVTDEDVAGHGASVNGMVHKGETANVHPPFAQLARPGSGSRVSSRDRCRGCAP